MNNEVFVFGSNLAGIHGAGSALHAKNNCGAVYGVGVGRRGMSYAIPTKDGRFNVLSIETIKKYVDDFIHYANVNPDTSFKIVAIGCGLAGYTPKQIAPLFVSCPANCILPKEFTEVISNLK